MPRLSESHKKTHVIAWQYETEGGELKTQYSVPLTFRRAVKEAEKLRRKGGRVFVYEMSNLPK